MHLNDTNATLDNSSSLNETNVSAEHFDFWSPAYDDANMTVEQIEANITEFSNCSDWFNQFFGADGLAALYYATPITPPIISPPVINNIPSGLGPIIDWISKNVDMELQQRCTACKNQAAAPSEGGIVTPIGNDTTTPAHNETTPENNSTEGNTSGLPVWPVWDLVNYTIPENC